MLIMESMLGGGFQRGILNYSGLLQAGNRKYESINKNYYGFLPQRFVCHSVRHRKNKRMKREKLIRDGRITADQKFGQKARIEYVDPNSAVQNILDGPQRKFNESIELFLKLGINTSHGEQQVRGVAFLPNGIDKNLNIAVFSDDLGLEIAKREGIEILGDEALIEKIENNEISFDICLATSEGMPPLKRVAKILGPKGLMPNVKVKTLVKMEDLQERIQQAKCGQFEFRANEKSMILGSFAKRDMGEEGIKQNLRAMLNAIWDKKPEKIKKKTFLKSCSLKSTMGKMQRLNPVFLDPSSRFYGL